MTVHIDGMHCASCELNLEEEIRKIPGVADVNVSRKTGTATIRTAHDLAPSEGQIARAVRDAGYAVRGDAGPAAESPARRWAEIGGALVIILALYQLFRFFDLVSVAPSTSGALSAGGVLLIGIVAGMSSCLAVTGGLLLAIAAKHNELHKAETAWQRFLPLLHFNTGRLTSYFVLGGLVGWLGQAVTLSTRMTGVANIVIALIMLGLGLSILGLLPKGGFPWHPPKSLSRRITSLAQSDHPAAPFTLGALTFFLPCGFTQSLQLTALASGGFSTGAVTMFLFALGTLPSLLGISAVSSAASGHFSRLFLRFSGVLVVLLAVTNLQSGFALTGIVLPSSSSQTMDANAPSEGGRDVAVQDVFMTVTPYGTYDPARLTIRAGIPVRWHVDGTDAFGCTTVLTIPALNISRPLRQGENIIEFTAPRPGTLAFMCSMGMVRGSFAVL